MARYGIYRNPEREGFLLDVQADLLDHLNTRVVVPLLPVSNAPTPAMTLNPVFVIDDSQFVMVTQFMAAVPSSLLKHKIGDLGAERLQITQALDLLFQGF